MRHEITLRFEASCDPREVRVSLLRDGREWLRCFVRSSGPSLRPSGEALLCFGLLPAIELGCDLRVESPVDRGLLTSSRQVQELVAGCTPGCRPVAVTAAAVDADYPAGRGHGVFFSGGVDSSYSLAVNKAALDGLVTLVGCDVSVTDRPRAEWLGGIARRVGAAYGVEPIVVETDLPEHMHPYLGWIEYHGAVLAGIRHLLADRFESMRVAASVDAASMWDVPWGSHPGIDPRLGTTGAMIAIDGFVPRPHKVVRLLGEPPLLEDLRVCYQGGTNCGECKKCLTTRITFAVMGNRRRVPCFPEGLPDVDDHLLRIPDVSVRTDMLVLRSAAVAAGGFEPLVGRIDRAVEGFDRRRATFVDRLRVKERLRRARHRWRFLRGR